jgi:hypothetical protein
MNVPWQASGGQIGTWLVQPHLSGAVPGELKTGSPKITAIVSRKRLEDRQNYDNLMKSDRLTRKIF